MVGCEADALGFRPIDLGLSSHLCLAFRRDSYVCSFGTDGEFAEEGAEAKYLQRLEERLSQWPGSCVHVWSGETIVGQIELRLRHEPSHGYVSLFYLVPEVRGSGAGDHLQAYAYEFFKQLGVTKARLSVSPSNHRALAYYAKHGWHDLGPRPGKETVHLLELAVGA